jgi:hypothetical protein
MISALPKKGAVFWNVTPCRSGYRHQPFGEVCCVHQKVVREEWLPWDYLKIIAASLSRMMVPLCQFTWHHILELWNLQYCSYYKYVGCKLWEATGAHSKLCKHDFFSMSRFYVSQLVSIVLFFNCRRDNVIVQYIMIHYLNTKSQSGLEMWHSELPTSTCIYMISCLCYINRYALSTVY